MIRTALVRFRESRSAVWFAAGASVLFLVLLCTVPYHVPSTPVVSDSYVFGYNNRAGEVIVAAWLVLLGSIGPALRRADAAGKPLTRSTFIKALAITGACCLLLYLATRGLNGYSESVYFNDRLRLILEGHLPYRDFEYAYGAGLLYGPALLVWVLRLPPGDAYGMFWMAASLVGVWLLYLTLHSIREFPGSQRAVFLLLWAYALTELFNVGLNYSLLRFVLPCWFATIVHRRLFSGKEQSRRWALLLPVPFYLVALLASPELAVAFAIGIVVYLACFGRINTPERALIFGAMILGLVAISWGAISLGVFSTLAAFRAGGYNFPLMPAPHLLLLFLLCAFAALYAGAELRARRPGVLLALIAVSAVSLAGGLGRADEVHALMNPLGVVIAGLLVVSGYRWLRRGVMAAAWFLTVIVLLPMFVRDVPIELAKAQLPTFFAQEYRSTKSRELTAADRYLLARMTRQLGAESATEKFEERRFYARFLADGTARSLDLPAIFGMPAGTPFYAPFGFMPDRSGTYHSVYIDDGYFLGLVNVTTEAEVRRKIRELQSRSEDPLLLPPDFDQNCGPAGEGVRDTVSAVFRYPYRAPIMHRENLLAPFCEFLHTNFHEAAPSIPEHFGYLLWLPNVR